MSRTILPLLCCLLLAGCGGSSDPDPVHCGAAGAQRQVTQIEPGIGAELLTLGYASLQTVSQDTDVLVTVRARRWLSTPSGVRGTPGAVAAYQFVRLRLDGAQWMSLSSATPGDAALPLPAGACVLVEHSIDARVRVPAGASLSAESVWSVVRPPAGQQLAAVTESVSVTLSTTP